MKKYTLKKQYKYQKDERKTHYRSQKIQKIQKIQNVILPDTRCVILGLNYVIDPFEKTEKQFKKYPKFVVYDRVDKCILTFDIRDLYEIFIVKGNKKIRAETGVFFTLTEATINTVKSMYEKCMNQKETIKISDFE